MRQCRVVGVALGVIGCVIPMLRTGSAQAADEPTGIVISEIMYNPDSKEGRWAEISRTEWVEIYNPTQEPINVNGWLLADEDGSAGPLSGPTKLMPGEAAVITAAECGVEEFQKAWGTGFKIIAVKGWGHGEGISGLANNPSEDNEVLQLRGNGYNVQDEVNYLDTDPWPKDSPDGASIYVLPEHLNPEANDAGESWSRSEEGDPGVVANRPTEIFNGRDYGSPGVVYLGQGKFNPAAERVKRPDADSDDEAGSDEAGSDEAASGGAE